MGFLRPEALHDAFAMANLPQDVYCRGLFDEAAEELARGNWIPDPGEYAELCYALRTLGRTVDDLRAAAAARRAELGGTMPAIFAEKFCGELNEFLNAATPRDLIRAKLRWIELGLCR